MFFVCFLKPSLASLRPNFLSFKMEPYKESGFLLGHG